MPKDAEASDERVPPVLNAVEVRVGREVLEAAVDEALTQKWRLVVVPTDALAFLLGRT